MSIDLSKFEAASNAAEGWISTVGMVVHLGHCGQIDPAFKLLLPTPSTKDGRPYNLHDSYSQHAEVLDQARDLLATLSDSPVKWEHGRGLSGVARVPAAVYPHIWSSAHEAAAGIARLTLELLAWPVMVITDPSEQWALAKQLLERCWKALTMTLDEKESLCERIRRERAKLFAQNSPPLAGQPREQARPDAEDDSEDSLRLSLTDNEYTVLRALRDKLPCRILLEDLSADTGIDRKVCGSVITSLIRSGLAERPSPRKGATITPAGKKLLEIADAPRRPSVDSR
jgi:DNA-binding MarR family transcriptional regulator